MVRLRWRTVPCEKSMDLYGPQSDCTVLWTMIGSHGSNSYLVLSLKTASFHPFFFFFYLYGVVWSIHIEQNLTLKRWNPCLTLSITLWAFCLSLTLLITSLVFASLPHHRHSSAQIAAQSISQVTLSITLYLSLTLISASLLRRRRSSLSASFCHSYSIASLPRLQGTLFILILLSFMSIYIFCPIFEGNQVYFSNKNNNQEREREKEREREREREREIQSMFLVHYSLLICCCKDLWLW